MNHENNDRKAIIILSTETSIYINTIINQNRNNYIKSVEGFGCKRVLGV